MSSDDAQSLIPEFAPASRAQWRAKAEADLDTQTVEGPSVRALYSAEDGAVGPRPPSRTPGFRIALSYARTRPASLVEDLRADAAAGLEAAWVILHGDLRAGARAPVTRPGTVLAPADVGPLLEALSAKRALAIDAGLAAPELVRAVLRHRATTGNDAVVCDPLAVLASTGGLGTSVDQAYAALAATTTSVAAEGASLRTILIDGVTAHDAGASAEQEVAIAICSGLHHLDRLQAHGLSAVAALPHFVLRMSVGSDLMLEVAKLRAVRRLWDRVCAHCGAGSLAATPLWAQTSWRHATSRDPWVNLLRGTVGAFAAVAGGASVVSVAPFTETLGVPSADARRLALNTQHILRGESHVGAVDDPAAGSFAFETLTDDLAQRAWALVQGWLERGGIAAMIERGELQAEVAERAAARSQALATGTLVATGTTLYPQLDERPPQCAPDEEVASGLTEAAVTTAAPLAFRRLTEPFEKLRDDSDARANDGERAAASLVVVGDANKARPQLDFARNIASVGGFSTEVVHPDAETRVQSLAILCGPPEALAEAGAPIVQGLLAQGTKRVLVAGRPTDALREAGVHDFVHRGRDVVALLSALCADLTTSTGGKANR